MHRPASQEQAPLAQPRVRRRRRRRSPGSGFPYNTPFAIAAVVFVAAFVVPIVWVFLAVDFGGGGGGFGGVESHDGPSLVPRERFSQAWGKVREEAGSEGSLTVLRVAPDRIDAVVNRAGGQRLNVQVRADLSVLRFPAGSGGQRGLSLSRFDTGLPDRLLRRAAKRAGASRDDVNYLALSATPALGGGGIWSVFFKDGRHVTADYDGSNMRVPGQ
ncbi:MAG TPA: hypothetical protein VF715_05965 [Thermoleophilaceae bacterium]